MSSNIPKARELVWQTACRLPKGRNRTALVRAWELMHRAKPVKRAKGRRIKVDDATRKQVHKMAKVGHSNHDIAERLGLRNAGRVSEILRGQR